MPTLGSRIKELRKEKGLTQEGLAEMMGISKGTVSVWEREQKRPSFAKLDALCDLFGVKLTYLLGESTPKTPPSPTDKQLGQWRAEENEEYEEEKKVRRYARMMAKLSKPTQRIVFATIHEAYKVDEETGVLSTQEES